MAQATINPTTSVNTNPINNGLNETVRVVNLLTRMLCPEARRKFAVRLHTGATIPAQAGQDTRFTLVLNKQGALRRMLLPPNELTLGEAYLDGDFDVEGDIVAAMELGDVFEKLAVGPKEMLSVLHDVRALPKDNDRDNAGHGRLARGRQSASLRGEEHSKARDREAISYHYDVGNDFYRLFLDSRMIYSCGYFPTGKEDLDTAQEKKLDHICRKLRLRPGERLLDIGCGWGGLIIHAAQRYGVKAVGITLSQPQADLANQRIAEAGLADRCQAMILDYRDVESLGAFDAITSVGMVEHVGKDKLKEYFDSAWKALKPGGLFLNHGITSAAKDVGSHNPLDKYLFRRGAFIRKYVFPDGELTPVGDILSTAERTGFEIRDVESLREHYALTLRHWVKNLESNEQEALRIVDDRTYRVWRIYMAGCSHAFKTARLSVHQALLSKPDERGLCPLPWSRNDLYS